MKLWQVSEFTRPPQKVPAGHSLPYGGWLGVAVSLSISINHIWVHLELSFHTIMYSLCLPFLHRTIPRLKHFTSSSPVASVSNVCPFWRIYIIYLYFTSWQEVGWLTADKSAARCLQRCLCAISHLRGESWSLRLWETHLQTLRQTLKWADN